MIANNLEDIYKRIRLACERAGRDVSAVKLLAVSKKVVVQRIDEAFSSGQCDFAENYVQEAVTKMKALNKKEIAWHAIGPVQRRKVPTVLEHFDVWHSLESEKQLKMIQKTMADRAETVRCKTILAQINIANEPQKAGVRPDDIIDFVKMVADYFRGTELMLNGLMIIPPFSDIAESSRPYFSALREMAARVNSLNLDNVDLTELSMGMSQDFEIAIEEQATLVRVGRAIFGERD